MRMSGKGTRDMEPMLTQSEDVVWGAAVIAGTRVPVDTLFEYLESWRGRRREIARAREIVCDFLMGKNAYGSSAESLDGYFLRFAVAARVAHDDSALAGACVDGSSRRAAAEAYVDGG